MAMQWSGYTETQRGWRTERDEGARESAPAFGADDLARATLAGRCGSDVVRLVDDWPRLVAALVGAGIRAVRIRHGFAVTRVGGDGVYQLQNDHLVVERDSVRVLSPTERWASAYLRIGARGDRSFLVVYDEEGRPVAEFVLSRRQLERLAESLPALEDGEQVPHHPPKRIPKTPRIRHHSHNDRWLKRQWRRGPYATIEKIEERMRLSRRDLFDVLDRRWAVPIAVESLREVVETGVGSPARCRLTQVSAAGRVDWRVDGIETAIGGRAMVLSGERAQTAVDPGRIDAVYAVRKPTDEGVAMAIEAFGADDRGQLRVRPPQRAASARRMQWRACLPFGRMCTG